nr:hypothetical protein [Leptospira noguchii]
MVELLQKESSSNQICTKPLFGGHHQNLNSILTWVPAEKKFSKSMSSYNFIKFFRKIVICSSSHIIL